MDPSLPLAAWRPLLPGVALWALALYLPVSLALGRLEERLAAGPEAEGASDDGRLGLLLAAGSLALALLAGLGAELGLCWALGPGWATSLGLLTALWGLAAALAARRAD